VHRVFAETSIGESLRRADAADRRAGRASRSGLL